MGKGYEPKALRCPRCSYELLTPARLFADRDRECPVCTEDMAPIDDSHVDLIAVSPWH